jgi:hypothetical protein
MGNISGRRRDVNEINSLRSAQYSVHLLN